MVRERLLPSALQRNGSINQAHTNASDQLRSLYNSQFPSIEGVGHIAEILVPRAFFTAGVLLSHWAYVVRVCVGPGLQVKGAKRYAEYIANSKYALNLLVKCQQDNPTFAKFMKQVRSFPS